MKFDDIKKRILNNYKLLVSTKIIGGLASAITLLIIARFLGVYFFGIFAMIISSVEILNILISFRVWDTTVKFIGDNATNKQNISKYISFSFSLIFSSFSSLFILKVSSASVIDNLLLYILFNNVLFLFVFVFSNSYFSSC